MKTKAMVQKRKNGLLCMFFLGSILFSHSVFSQGCVAIRHMATCSSSGIDTMVRNNKWQFTAGYRWYRSHRHFRGTEEQTIREQNHSEVINLSHALDLSLTYFVNDQLNISLAAPVSYTDRSSLYEHDQVNRYHTQSHGLGDMRLTATYWLWSPHTHMKRNIAFGLGVKAPTGNWNVQDQFHTAKGIVTHAVDQSIQLGDGGWGIILETQGYLQLHKRASVYFNGFYLINPRNTNGTLTGRKDVPQANAIVSVMSVCDQYMARAGVNYRLSNTGGLYALLISLL